MANEKHIALLRQGFKVWNLWRKQNPQIIPELKGADLTGLHLFKADLSGADLSEVDFSGASLYQADLRDANLCKANLSTAILQEADFSGASLIEANLKGKKFYSTNFRDADLSGADLSGINLNGVGLNGVNLNGANLSGADLSGVILMQAKLDGANLSGANLSRAILMQAKLNGANLSGANLSRVALNGVALNGVNLNGAILSEVDLSVVNLNGANLSGVNLQYANLRQAQIQEAIIDEKWSLVWDILNNGTEKRHLQGADLSMADLEGANLCEADLSNVNLTGTKLNRSNLAKSNLVKANLGEANLGEANLRDADLSNADLSNADLRDADLRGANLSNASLEYAKLNFTQIQEAIIDEKWSLVWDILNSGAEKRHLQLQGADLSMADLEGANLCEADLSNVNLTGTKLNRSNLAGSNLVKADLSNADLSNADLSNADLSNANFRKANLTGANFDFVDFSDADLSEVEGLESITYNGAFFSGTSSNLEITLGCMHMTLTSIGPIRDKKDFFENLLSWQSQEVFNESIKKSLSLSGKGFIPGVLLYTDEDDKLALYVREHFDALDKLTGDWCTIYLLENPSPKWRKANQNWRKAIETSLHANWFRSKPYDKSEAYDIARQLDVESSSLPCLVLISPANLSEKLVLPIGEVSPEYFRKLFATLEKLVKGNSSEKLNEREASSQVFDCLKLNFNEIVNFLEKYASKEENNRTKYILKGDNIFVSIEPVNIGNVNYNEKIEGDLVQGDYTNQSRNLTVGDIGGDFKPIGSALLADNFGVSGTAADSINFDQGMSKGGGLQNQQDDKSPSKNSKFYESKSIGKVVIVVGIVLALLSGLVVYIYSSKHPMFHPSQEQRTKE